MIEIRWHGRGGQGVKSAALLLAETVIEEGRFGQGFPEYGPERMGAPVRGYNRVDGKPIRLHCGIKRPNIVIVLDESLLVADNIREGLAEDGLLLVNTARCPHEIHTQLGLGSGQRAYTVDATQIALDTIGKPIPNTVMIGALMKLTRLMDLDRFEHSFKKKFQRKFAPRVLDGNLQAIRRAYEEVASE
jgi:pyruvate ferredoxin oxidoreductase gamma subunit